MKLVHDTKEKFIKQFLALISQLTPDQAGALVWTFGNDQWSMGYGEGIRENPDVQVGIRDGQCDHVPYAPGAVNLNHVKCAKCNVPLQAVWKTK